MITAVREWLTSIVVTAMLLSVAQAMIPEGSIRKLASFTGGLILLVTMLRPALGMDLRRLNLELEDYQSDIAERQAELAAAAEQERKAIIESRTAAYISDKADTLGLDVTVSVKAEAGPEGVIVPWSAELWGERSAVLAAYMETELGIRAERQVWHEGEN